MARYARYFDKDFIIQNGIDVGILLPCVMWIALKYVVIKGVGSH